MPQLPFESLEVASAVFSRQHAGEAISSHRCGSTSGAFFHRTSGMGEVGSVYANAQPRQFSIVTCSVGAYTDRHCGHCSVYYMKEHCPAG